MQVGSCLRGFRMVPSLQQPLSLQSVTALTSQLLQRFSAMAEGVLCLLRAQTGGCTQVGHGLQIQPGKDKSELLQACCSSDPRTCCDSAASREDEVSCVWPDQQFVQCTCKRSNTSWLDSWVGTLRETWA